MTRALAASRVVLLVASLIVLSAGFALAPTASAGSCVDDCGCDGGAYRCCVLLGGATCLDNPPDM
jgi:hypothetical protein